MIIVMGDFRLFLITFLLSFLSIKVAAFYEPLEDSFYFDATGVKHVESTNDIKLQSGVSIKMRRLLMSTDD